MFNKIRIWIFEKKEIKDKHTTTHAWLELF